MDNINFTYMTKDHYKVIALMSGTSLDGIDIIYTEFQKKDDWSFKILNFQTVPYSKKWKEILKSLTQQSKNDLIKIDKLYSKYLGEVVREFVYNESISNFDFIASHGHTAIHKPGEKYTYQIGNQQIFADTVNKKVICDFRVQDVEFGGQGAPLVPIGDKLLFSDYDCCINLGGFSNISLDEDNERIAFDICPVNIVLNYYVSKLDLDYDNNGNIAKTGKVNYQLLDELNGIDFYKKHPPKSLGLEWVEEHIFPLIDINKIPVKDILRTFVEHCAIHISRHLKKKSTRALFTGGGVYNSFLIERIVEYSNTEVVIPDKTIIEFKEALIFGLLGVLKERNEINCLKSVTGAITDHSSGVVLLPRN